MGSAWNQLEQMLTCAICLDKFKNPRLLPCQHSFCGDACMDGLVDYARRQIKCPECRAEHRIPYQGVQSLPLNVTLIRFLELHARITGEEPEPVPTFMEKCGICGEKVEGVQRCSHCEKKVCPECKEAHIDLLRREISRINGQSRRSVSKIGEFSEVLKKAEERLHVNHASVRREIEESCKRLIDDLQSKQRRLLEEVDSYVEQEEKTIDKLKVSVTDELDVLESNLKMADEKLTSSKFQWNDAELSECKEIYNKAMEFVRLFDPEIGDFTRKIRFILIPEFETLRRRLCELGELKFAETAQSLIANSFQYCNATGSVAIELCQAAANATSQQPAGGYGLAHSNSNTNIDSQLARLQASQAGTGGLGQMLELPNALMRSQSDHRLASQFQARMKQQEAAAKNGAASRYGRQSEFEQDSLRSRYAPPRTAATSAKDYSSDLLRDWPRPSDNDDALSSLGSSIQFKSAFMRRKEKERQHAYGAYVAPVDLDDDDLTSEASYGGSLSASGRNVRFYDQQLDAQQQAALAAKSLGPKVFDCKEVVHAPLSGVPKLEECPQFQTRLHQLAAKAVVDKKRAEEEGRRDKDLVESARAAMTKASERIKRQMSGDELEKQKQANKALEQQQRAATPNSVRDLPDGRPHVSPARDSSSTSATASIGTAHATQASEGAGRALASDNTSQQQPATNSGSASSSPATPTSTSAMPGGRRSLYGQAVTERSKRQLSSAIQESASYTSRRRSSLVRDQGSESQEHSEVVAEAQQALAASSSSGSATASQSGSSGAVKRRALRSTGRSMSKQSSSERQQSLDAGTSPTTITRRRRLLRGESSRQESVDSSATAANTPTTSDTTPITERNNQSKNCSIGSGGGEPSLDQDDERSSLASRRVHQDSPVGAGSRLYAGRQATSTTTDEDDNDEDDDDSHDSSKNTGTIRPAAKLRQQSTAGSVASRERRGGSKSRDDSPDEANSAGDEEAADEDEESTGDKRAGTKRRSREFLPSAMNKLLDRSAQIRRDSQEQRTRGDSPQRSSGASPMSSEARQSAYSTYSRPSSGMSAIRQRLAYQRSQSIRDQDEEATTSSQSLYTTASSQASGRRSSNEDELHLSSSSSGRRPSTGGSSTDRTVIPSRLDRDASDRTDSARSSTATTTTSRYSSGRRDSTGDDGGGYTSRFLARSRTSAALSSGRGRDYNSERDNHHDSSSNAALSSNKDSPRSYLSSRDRFMQSVGSSGASGSSSAGASNASAPLSSGYLRQAGSSAGTIKTHSEYLRNKFSRRGSSNSSSNSSNLLSRSRSSHLFSRHDSSNYSTRGSQDSEEDEHDDEGQDLGRLRRSSAASGTTGSRRSSLLDSTGSFDRDCGGVKSSIYSPKGRMLFKLGSRGSEPGNFTWPRGVAVGSLGSIVGGREIVVADSSNHRVQIFDSTGRFMNEFGSYGSAEGEFDCLAGVALNRRQKQYVVSDRYNHRIQLFEASGRFVRAFGEMGKDQGKFNLPWGIACDSTSGSIYVCDKENHRVQVFDSHGQYVSKFGSGGAQAGQLQHPHYIAVGYGKVVLTDTNNHRVQLFDLSGRMIKVVGKEGSAPGQFKFPRGIAMDDQGHLIVGDSGNNRLQVFSPEGAFIKAIGTWGSSEGEFKGIEGVAVDSSSNKIFVCDRENHRIQVF